MLARSGVLIIDNSALKFLEKDGARRAFRGNCRAADWVPWVTAVNALEAVKNENVSVRKRIFATLRWLADGRGFLPWPELLLQKAAEAIRDRRPGYRSEWSGWERLLGPDAEVTDESRRNAAAFIERREKAFDDVHAAARKQIQVFLKKHQMHDNWQTAQEFLNQQWMTPGHIDDYIVGMWKELDLTGEVPVEALRADELWRLFLETYGIAAYERAVVRDQEKRAHFPDLIQLMYLAGGSRRVIVSEDAAFRRAANRVLRGRYPAAEAVPVGAFL